MQIEDAILERKRQLTEMYQDENYGTSPFEVAKNDILRKLDEIGYVSSPSILQPMLYDGLISDRDRIIPTLPQTYQVALEEFTSKRPNKFDITSELENDCRNVLKGGWLGDEVINSFIKMRESERVGVMSSYFYTKLISKPNAIDYNNCKRWATKAAMFKHEVVLIPINIRNVHWVIAVVDNVENTVVVYDSLGGYTDNICSNLIQFIQMYSDEFELCKPKYTELYVEDNPKQRNGSDCGAFTCKIADCISLDVGFDFSQSDMKFVRQHIVAEILMQKNGKPQDKEWSVFASLLSINSSNVVNIHSFATGNKSLPSSLYNIDVINDSHAEVLCKRGFQIFLMDELLHPTFLQWNKYLNQYEWNNKHQLILYISQPPCGDCCISNNKTDSGAKRIINNSINNTVALWEEDDIESSLGSTRIKPGKGEKSLSMSCSDKIVKWGVLGLQGGYLSNYISPITIQTILIEEPNDIKAIHRGLHDRILNFSSHFLSNNIDLKIKPPHCYSIPSISLITHYSNDLPASGSAINYIMNNKEEVTIGTRGIKFGAPKKIVEAHRSRLCRRKMIDKYLKVIEQRKQEEETTEPHKTKQQKYLNNKQMMYDTIKGGWTKKPQF
ncbi:tRNA-specific adenosine deaminase [Entamoeba marina]